MAMFSWEMQVIKRSTGRSVVNAAAYRAGEKLRDERTGITHDYSRRSGVEHTEIIAPEGAHPWVYDRSTLWNRVEAKERKDGQLARELRMAIPRELAPEARIELVRDYVTRTFVSRGMVADIAIHNKTASDGGEQPHAHVLLTMRVLAGDDFGGKSRHDWIPHPEGLKHPNGKPVLVMSNPDSWNSPELFDQARLDWENAANDALERAGREERIDRRSLLERGIARMPEPALRMAWHMKELKDGMKQRFGQYLAAKHFGRVETAARTMLDHLEHGHSKIAKNVQTVERFLNWFDRQIDRLATPPPERNLSPEASRGRGIDL